MATKKTTSIGVTPPVYPTGLSYDSLAQSQSLYGTNRELLAQKAQPISPVVSSQPQLTAANGFGSGVADYVSPYDQISIDRYNESQTPIDADAIRKQKIREFQQQIDATNQIFTNLTAQAQIQGQDRLGQTRALAARSGNLEQPTGNAQLNNQVTANNQVLGDIGARQTQAIGAILSDANARADAEIAQKEQAKQAGAASYVEYLKGAEDRKATNAQAVLQGLLQQGLSLEDIPQDQFQQLSNSLRVTPQELQNIYKGELAKAAAAQEQAEYERSLKDRDFALQVGEFGLKQDEFGFEKDKFGAEFGLKQDQFGFEQNKFANEFGLEREKFGFDQNYKNAQLGLERDKLSVDQQYKLDSLGIERDKLTIAQQKLLADDKTLSPEAKKLNALALGAQNNLNIIQSELFDSNGNLKRTSGIIKKGLGINGQFNTAVTDLSDIIGRLRSGGAITDLEVNNFKKLIPNVTTDSSATIKSKMERLKLMFDSISPDGGVSSPSQDQNKSELDDFLGGSSGTNPKAD